MSKTTAHSFVMAVADLIGLDFQLVHHPPTFLITQYEKMPAGEEILYK